MARRWRCRGTSSTTSTHLEVNGRKVAEVSKKWFRVRDTYGVQVGPEADTLLVLAVAVALDVMEHPGE